MMKLAVLALFGLSVFSADKISGIWLGQISTRQGDIVDVSLQLSLNGTKIGGKLYGDYKSNPIVDGYVWGEAVMFVVQASEQAGNQINESRLRFTGKLNSNGELELTRERETSVNAGNTGSSVTRPGQNQRTVIRFKRLI